MFHLLLSTHGFSNCSQTDSMTTSRVAHVTAIVPKMLDRSHLLATVARRTVPTSVHPVQVPRMVQEIV